MVEFNVNMLVGSEQESESGNSTDRGEMIHFDSDHLLL